MQPKFNIEDGWLVEQPRMRKPYVYSFSKKRIQKPETLAQNALDHFEYEQHIKSLRRYPILPGSKWPKTEGLEEGFDFTIIGTPPVPRTSFSTSIDPIFNLCDIKAALLFGLNNGDRENIISASDRWSVLKDYFKTKYNIDL